jgi:hypothetical protein
MSTTSNATGTNDSTPNPLRSPEEVLRLLLRSLYVRENMARKRNEEDSDNYGARPRYNSAQIGQEFKGLVIFMRTPENPIFRYLVRHFT